MTSHPGLQGAFWPTRTEELLLKTALLDGDAARSAWAEVRESFDLDGHTGDSFRLMPLLYRSLRSLGIDDPYLPRMRGFVRRTWYANRVLFNDVAASLHTLDEAGVETLALKGAALVAVYGDASLRPMGDFDLLVPPGDARRSVRLMERMGWRPTEPLTPKLLRLHHGLSMSTEDGRNCDLHWRVMKRFDGKESAVEDFWAASEPLEVEGARTRTLCPADQLLHVCVHGARWDSHANVRWAADAMMLLRNREVDWDRLVVMARRNHVTLPLRDTLSYLRSTLDAEVPPEVLADLAATPVSRREAYVYRIGGQRPEMGSVSRGFPLTVQRYARLSAGWSLPRTVASFPGYLQDTYRLRSAWQVPGYLLKRATGRVSGDEHKQRARQA